MVVLTNYDHAILASGVASPSSPVGFSPRVTLRSFKCYSFLFGQAYPGAADQAQEHASSTSAARALARWKMDRGSSTTSLVADMLSRVFWNSAATRPTLVVELFYEAHRGADARLENGVGLSAIGRRARNL